MLFAAGIRPNWPGSAPRLEAATEIWRSDVGRIHRLGIVRITGVIPADGNPSAQGVVVWRWIPYCHADATIVDFSQVQCICTPEWAAAFIGSMARGRMRFVVPAQWGAVVRTHGSIEDAVVAIEEGLRRAGEPRPRHEADPRLLAHKPDSPLDLHRAILRGGLGPIWFGMSMEQVKALMGPPERATGTDEGLVLEYSDLEWPSGRVELIFREISGRGSCLVTIRTNCWDVYIDGIPLVDEDEFVTAGALARIGVSSGRKWNYHGFWVMGFSHGLALHGVKGPCHEVEWTILPENGRVEDIDWSGRDCVG